MNITIVIVMRNKAQAKSCRLHRNKMNKWAWLKIVLITEKIFYSNTSKRIKIRLKNKL